MDSFGEFYEKQLRERLERAEAGERSPRLERAMKTGDFQGLSWSEFGQYVVWMGLERKDCRLSLRMGAGDLMKLKFIARKKGHRYQTYVRDLLKRHVRQEEERMARPRPRRFGLGSGRRGAGAPR